MRKPMIGVLPLYDAARDSYWMLPGYMHAIEAAGGIPVMLPMASDAADIARLADTFDGLLFTGGHDVDPHLYGEAADSACGERCEARDRLEHALFEHVMTRDIPALGICRGLQLFNVLLGGTLYQDLPSQRESAIGHRQTPPYDRPVHEVELCAEGLLSGVLGRTRLAVNSYHHQGIKELAPRLRAAAVADDGLIEAVELPGHRCLFAVQWHPEFSYATDPASLALFRYFITVCSKTYGAYD